MTAPRDDTPSKRPRLLLADDDELLRRVLVRGLEPEFDVVPVARGDHALEAAHTHRPDIALLDVRMPGLDGVQVATKLAEAEPLLPLVLMSAESPPPLPAPPTPDAPAPGTWQFIQKPFGLAQLRSLLLAALAPG